MDGAFAVFTECDPIKYDSLALVERKRFVCAGDRFAPFRYSRIGRSRVALAVAYRAILQVLSALRTVLVPRNLAVSVADCCKLEQRLSDLFLL